MLLRSVPRRPCPSLFSGLVFDPVHLRESEFMLKVSKLPKGLVRYDILNKLVELEFCVSVVFKNFSFF